MKVLSVIFLFLTVVTGFISGNETDKFPEYFMFGTATSAYQIEGGWNEDGKGPHVWDDLVHNVPQLIIDGSNGDVGPDSYHFYKDDIKALKEIGVNFYRFSVSWSRVLPEGDTSVINELGINYYNKLINELLENGIEPIITIFHWDLPRPIHNLGGFINPIIVEHLTNYSNLLFSRFGDRVKRWITFNQPHTICVYGYGNVFAVNSTVRGLEYLCGHNLLKAHANIYHLYKNNYREQNGTIGISMNSMNFYSKGNNTKWIEDRALQYFLGWFAHPIYSESGGYPSIMINEIKENSLMEGHNFSRLPEFDEKTKQNLKGSADFIGLNYYTSRYVEYGLMDNVTNILWEKDSKLILSVDDSWIQAASSWVYSVPKGLNNLLKWIKNEYNNKKVIITENGWSDRGEINDYGRINYIGSHLNEVLKAIHEDNCNVIGYTVWSLIDNFEWFSGYTEKFGIYKVNLTSPMKEREAKKSSVFFRDIIKTKRIPDYSLV